MAPNHVQDIQKLGLFGTQIPSMARAHPVDNIQGSLPEGGVPVCDGVGQWGEAHKNTSLISLPTSLSLASTWLPPRSIKSWNNHVKLFP